MNMMDRPKFRRKFRKDSSLDAEDQAAPVEPLESRTQRLARRKAEEEAQARRDADAARARAEAARQAEEEHARRKAEEARQRAEAEAAQQAAEELARRRAVEERKRAEAARKAEEDRKRQEALRQEQERRAEQEAARIAAKQEAERQAAEELARKQEQQRKRRVEMEARIAQEDAARRAENKRRVEEAACKAREEAERLEAQALKAAQDEAQALREAEEKARLEAEERAKQRAEAKKRAEAEAARLAELEAKRRKEEARREEQRLKAQAQLREKERIEAERAERAKLAAAEKEARAKAAVPLELSNPIAPARPKRPEGEPSKASHIPQETISSGGLTAWDRMGEFEVDEGHLAENRIITATREDPAYTAFDVLRTRLLQALNENGWKRVAITSPTKDCGKTFTAANLAISLSRQENCRTLLLDCDMRRPTLQKVMGMAHPGSMGDMLRGKVDPQDHLLRLGKNRINAGRNIAFGFNEVIEPYASELLQDPRTAETLAKIEQSVAPDVMLFDLPPALYYDDVIAFRPQFDGVLLVIGGGITTEKEIKEVERRLGEETPLLGMVLNKAENTEIDKYHY